MKILLNSSKNINSIDEDVNIKIDLNNNVSRLVEYDLTNILNVNDIYEYERNNTDIYRIYGSIRYLSLLNGLVDNEDRKFEDFFNQDSLNSNAKNIYNSFDFYLVMPSSGSTKITDTDNNYIRNFEVLATPNEIDIINAGFSKNIYGDDIYSFIINTDIDITDKIDSFGIPINEIYLYVKYNKWDDLVNTETVYITEWDSVTGSESLKIYNDIEYEIGDILTTTNYSNISDVVEFINKEYSLSIVENQTIYIDTKYDNGSKTLRWKYNPLIPMNLKYFTSEIYNAYTGNTSYDVTNSIPDHAIDVGDGYYVWRNILSEGFYDPISGNGNDIPFVNKRRYLFNNLNLNIIPDLTNSSTLSSFDSVWFDENSTSNYITTNNNIDNIGDPC